jgi:hypothetical protein
MEGLGHVRSALKKAKLGIMALWIASSQQPGLAAKQPINKEPYGQANKQRAWTMRGYAKQLCHKARGQARDEHGDNDANGDLHGA